ncbi:hypothetical protein [Rhodococcus qingshengii]|uniref:hypothetical protein n=1 Tax=Rhodococcus qingshengii TaxID=334542 RepID=UPI001ADEF318|nr:hypothetical protein [Rhodococcus qingshengii]
MTLTEQLHNCQDLLARAQLAGDQDAIRRFSSYRLTLIHSIADSSLLTWHDRTQTSSKQ